MAGSSLSASDSLECRLVSLIGERVLELSPDFSPESNLYDAGLDSLAIMQLLLVLEEEFSVSIPVESVSRKNFSTVRAIGDLLREKGADSPEMAAVESADAPAIEPETVAAAPVETARGLPYLRGCDYFVLSFDAMSRRTGQGGHKAHSFLLLDRPPAPERLRDVLREASERFPMLCARLERKWIFGLPRWVEAAAPAPLDLQLYIEEGAPGALAACGARVCKDALAIADDIVNTPMPTQGARSWPKGRFSLIELRDGSAMLIFSWSHLMIDGVGAEILLKELERLNAGLPGQQPLAIEAADAQAGGGPGWLDRLQAARPMVQFFNKLVELSFGCLGPLKPEPGRTHFETFTLTPEQTRAATARCAELCGELMSMPFYLACAARAHDRVFAQRGQAPRSQVCSVPVQTRRKGPAGPIFQNHLTMFFGVLDRGELGSLEKSVASLLDQHARYHRDKLGESLNGLMQMMAVLPPSIYMRFIQMQMRGPFASFFHSNTGEFAAGLDRFLGAEILSAFHVPGIATPPGTGIFINTRSGRMVITTCWHENALSDAERRLMIDQLLADFGVQ